MSEGCDKMPQMQSSPLHTRTGIIRHRNCRSVEVEIRSEEKKYFENPYCTIPCRNPETIYLDSCMPLPCPYPISEERDAFFEREDVVVQMLQWPRNVICVH